MIEKWESKLLAHHQAEMSRIESEGKSAMPYIPFDTDRAMMDEILERLRAMESLTGSPMDLRYRIDPCTIPELDGIKK